MKLHVRHDGRSRTLDAELLGLESGMEAEEVEEVLRREGLLPRAGREPVVIDRHPDSWVVRPPAVFG